MNAIFDVDRPAGCLSGWQISRYTLDELSPTELAMADAHLSVCSRCADLLRAERADVAAARLEALPAALRLAAAQPPRRRTWWPWGLPLIGALATAALALLIATPASPPSSSAPREGLVGSRLKGGAELRAAVLRGTELVADGVSLSNLGPLRDGDRLRLSAPAAAGHRVTLEGLEGGRWRSYFEGDLPADGLLPVGVAVSADDITRLRWAVCPSGVSADAALRDTERCATREFTLEVKPSAR